MSMTVGGSSGGHSASINVTPMIDLMLVLLILFLIIQPALTKGLDVQVPAETSVTTDAPSPDQIILHVRRAADGVAYSLNDIEVSDAELATRIHAIYAGRARKVLFVKGEESVSFSAVVRAMDVARGAGMEVIGLVPRPTAPAP